MIREGEVPSDLGNKIISDLESLMESASEEISSLVGDESVRQEIWISAWRKALHAQKSAVRDAEIRGLISETVAREIDEEIDEELAKLEE